VISDQWKVVSENDQRNPTDECGLIALNVSRNTFNPDFALAESTHRAATHLFGAGGVNPACPAVAVASGGTTCKFCLSAEQAGKSIAKFGFNVLRNTFF